MGNAASLFFNTTTPSECLDWRIRPSDDQYDAQKERWKTLAVHLLADLRDRSGYAMSSWLQGSYKFGTQVRPARTGEEFDIDLGVYYRWVGGPEGGAHEPAELKAFIQASLEAYIEDEANDAEGVSAPKPRCNRIHFADDFHIDVPSYHLDASRDARTLATEENGWEVSDPKAIYQWWKEKLSDAERPRVRRLVRYLKMWASLAFPEGGRPSSILLTVLVAEAYRTLDSDAFNGDDEFFSAVVHSARDRFRRSQAVRNPVDDTEDLNRLSKEESEAFLAALEDLQSIADRALAVPTKAQSADIWAEAFGHFFPVPPEEEVLVEMAKALVPVLFMPEIDVVATAATGSVRTFRGLNSIGPIPKDCDIEFTLANAHALPPGAVVTWTVRNAGKEAERENDLGHFKGVGLSTREQSSYTGQHFMDISVRNNGVLIGRRRVPVTIYGVTMPKRNTAQPGWVRFRQKRK